MRTTGFGLSALTRGYSYGYPYGIINYTLSPYGVLSLGRGRAFFLQSVTFLDRIDDGINRFAGHEG